MNSKITGNVMLYSTGLFTLEMLKILARSNIKGESLKAQRSVLSPIINISWTITFIAFPVILFRQINTGCPVTTEKEPQLTLFTKLASVSVRMFSSFQQPSWKRVCKTSAEIPYYCYFFNVWFCLQFCSVHGYFSSVLRALAGICQWGLSPAWPPCHWDRTRLQRSLPGRSSVTAGDDRAARSQRGRCLRSFTSTVHPVHPEPRPQRPHHRLTKTQDQSQEKLQRMLGKPGEDFTEYGSEHVPCHPPTQCVLCLDPQLTDIIDKLTLFPLEKWLIY